MTSMIAVSIALALACVVAADSGVPACNSLKPVPLDYQWLIRSSPFTFYSSNSPIYQCGQIFFVGSAGNSTRYNATGIIIKGNYTFSYSFYTTDNLLFKSVLCANGIKKDFKIVYLNNNSPSASVCSVSCNNNDPTKYDIIACGGRTSKDERDIDDYFKSTLKGFKDIVNSQSGCPKPQYCDTFTN